MNDNNYIVVGTCSICGGKVVVPRLWYSVNPPVPKCRSCGAIKRNDLPVIPMTPRRPGKPIPYTPLPYDDNDDFNPYKWWDDTDFPKHNPKFWM